VFANSRDVASFFYKRHDHVLADIGTMVEDGVPDFRETPYIHPQKATRPMSSGRGTQHTLIISDGGLFKLIMRSNKPVAKQFQDWVAKASSRPSARTAAKSRVGEGKMMSLVMYPQVDRSSSPVNLIPSPSVINSPPASHLAT
jgi:hypothetical protein